ncbi:lysophospholipid acyltransferase family protein [Ktedonospora formicarum]|uniref:Phospholipid/glycerol acyltransferase domain-containing protein n=1 Tax=Ktedonospora formicarum TaxID=2778364 RepID=A0A8J3I047_9CHLR|nr:lysophospholipid acyltransferase family protein [Ktedonospora formicarum]GHO43668.1 hypothetical protein KSX_18310 [Ktedonospora formicarum]
MNQEQEAQQAPSPAEVKNAENKITPAKELAPSGKAKKNLYEPYVTPTILYNAIRTLAIVVLSLLARIRLRKRYNIPRQGPFIIAANHLSWTDIPLVPLFIPGKVVYMAKEELFYSKVGWLVRFLGAFPVKRGEADRQALRATDEQLKKGKIFIIFPEGTRSRKHILQKANDGISYIALRSGVPVLPVAIYGSENVLKKFGAKVTISYGTPTVFTPKNGKRVTKEDIQETTNTIMYTIASMMPPEYRGAYSNLPEHIKEDVSE